jgi:hypothetical protein
VRDRHGGDAAQASGCGGGVQKAQSVEEAGCRLDEIGACAELID